MSKTVNKVKELLAKISKWPWKKDYASVRSADGDEIADCSNYHIPIECEEPNADFISQAPQLLSELLEDVESLQNSALYAKNKKLRKALKDAVGCIENLSVDLGDDVDERWEYTNAQEILKEK